ncbi:hypothetical protein CPLU01_14945 [Colletotrichum plurivorum]|uniref:Biotrophy-associated secreted protein 3 n=1 Tax=Colletotrichum plurivorum TaxID=2175906 RepID=A0A8H6JFN3_9PEZI|nr:hypothetical protein CPLU01_14945 [Colletotrichum plurivorum]
MKFTLATFLTLVVAASAVPADAGAGAGLLERQLECGKKGFSCDLPGDLVGCCAGLTCRTTNAPVGGNGKACQ